MWLSFALFIVVIMYLITNHNEKVRDRKLLANAAFTIGQFTGEVKPYLKGSNGPWYVCTYEVNGNTFHSSEPVHLCKKLGKRLFAHTFPVIYDSTNPASGTVLIFSFEFEELNLKYPDSLNWVSY